MVLEVNRNITMHVRLPHTFAPWNMFLVLVAEIRMAGTQGFFFGACDLIGVFPVTCKGLN